MFDRIRRVLSQVARIGTPTPLIEENLAPPLDGEAFLQQGLSGALGPDAAREVLTELDYGHRVARMERVVELRRRELAAKAKLDSFR